MLVMGGALLVALPAYQVVLRTNLMKRPVIACAFNLPTATAVDARLLGGSALFGAGAPGSRPRARLRGAAVAGTLGACELLTAPAAAAAGWGMTGMCPGPALVNLITLQPLLLLFVSCMAVGWKLESLLPGAGKAGAKAAPAAR